MAQFEIKHEAMAGTLESSDIQITIAPNPGQGIDIKMQSSVERQFGEQIRRVIRDVLQNMKIEDAKIQVVDQGALDCTVKARTIAVVHRASDITENYDWGALEAWNV